jgi:CubicO group peptidase (beta-lactamase class C family)
VTKQTLSLLAFFASTVAHADAVDDRIVALMTERQVPGLSFAVVEGGAIARVGAYGVESLETSRSWTRTA